MAEVATQRSYLERETPDGPESQRQTFKYHEPTDSDGNKNSFWKIVLLKCPGGCLYIGEEQRLRLFESFHLAGGGTSGHGGERQDRSPGRQVVIQVSQEWLLSNY